MSEFFESHTDKPVLAEGEVVAVLGAKLLRGAADFFDALTRDNPGAPPAFGEMADACRTVAEAVERAPRGDPMRLDSKVAIEDLIPEGSEARITNADLAARMLADSAEAMRAVDGGEDELRAQLLASAIACDEVAGLLKLAPEARIGPELRDLRPYLEAGSGRSFDPPADPAVVDALMEEPLFVERAEQVFRTAYGKDFNGMAQEARHRWASLLAGEWIKREGPVPVALTPDQRAGLEHALAHPRADWVMPPILPGPWTEAGAGDAAVLLELISEKVRVGPARVPMAEALMCDRVRTRPLACHGGVLLVEAQGYSGDMSPGIVQALIHDNHILIADGASAPLHDFNDVVSPALDTAQARRDYLQLFVNWVRQDEGNRFQIIETPAQLADRLPGRPDLVEANAGHLAPLVDRGRDSDGAWRMSAVVGYDDALFRTVFAVTDTGLVEMVDDEPIASGVPLSREVQDGWLVRPGTGEETFFLEGMPLR